MLFIPLNPVIHYVLHKKYYAEVLCENKDKPMMHCNGKCHLKKEIKELEENKNNPNTPIPIFQNNKEVFPAIMEIVNRFSINSYLIKQFGNNYILPLFLDVFLDIILPPPKF